MMQNYLTVKKKIKSASKWIEQEKIYLVRFPCPQRTKAA